MLQTALRVALKAAQYRINGRIIAGIQRINNKLTQRLPAHHFIKQRRQVLRARTAAHCVKARIRPQHIISFRVRIAQAAKMQLHHPSLALIGPGAHQQHQRLVRRHLRRRQNAARKRHLHSLIRHVNIRLRKQQRIQPMIRAKAAAGCKIVNALL